MDSERLKKMAGAVRTGGKGTMRRKKKAVHKTTSTDDKRLQSTLKRLGVNTIPGIEEVNLFQADGTVVHFSSPKVQASIAANTFVVSGPSSAKKLHDLMPGILPQMGADNLNNLRRLAQQMPEGAMGGAGLGGNNATGIVEDADDDNDDDVPDLVENFEESSK
ncbi:hypothetical protein WJX73_007479 [Symbiochloris irregularis]|uniref:Nascent polypeptide-associated complex subunit beta n=1 Tax=Symbiochloris irregularis TaxID=706552 RepID=A0AAW1NVC7_9CHLO